MPGPRRPIGPDDYKAVKALHRKGLSRNEIARKLRRSGRTVSNIAAELGLSFDRGTMVQAAVIARKDDAKSRRVALALALLDDAERLRQQAWEQCVAYNFGGKDNTFNSMAVPEPSFRDKRDIYAALGICVEKAVRLDEYDKDADGGDAKSVLGDLMTGLRAAWDAAAPAQ